MSNLIDLNELRKQFADKLSLEEWKAFSEAQNQIVAKYEKQIKLLSEKNKHLEELLVSKTTDFAFEVSSTEIICVQQISRLETLSNERQLTLEEVKRLDLLVKNLKLIREESTIVVNSKSPALKEDELVAIAQSAEEDE